MAIPGTRRGGGIRGNPNAQNLFANLLKEKEQLTDMIRRGEVKGAFTPRPTRARPERQNAKALLARMAAPCCEISTNKRSESDMLEKESELEACKHGASHAAPTSVASMTAGPSHFLERQETSP